MKILDTLSSRPVKPFVLFLMGIIIYFSNIEDLTNEQVGGVVIFFSLLWIIMEYWTSWDVKKSLKSYQIKIPEHKAIAEYLEKNNHRYIYKPKECEKLFDFSVPDLDVYVNYWNENKNEQDRRALDKKAKKWDANLIKIPHYCIDDIKKLHGSFSNQLAKFVKKR